jgi:hypothetical protein
VRAVDEATKSRYRGVLTVVVAYPGGRVYRCPCGKQYNSARGAIYQHVGWCEIALAAVETQDRAVSQP